MGEVGGNNLGPAEGSGVGIAIDFKIREWGVCVGGVWGVGVGRLTWLPTCVNVASAQRENP